MQMSHKILYIEDDPFSRMLVRHILERAGYAVIEAADGLSGIQVALDQRPDLILMDIHISGLDGHEVATKLKSMPDLADTPIVALTASKAPGDRERSLISGCDGYITKPIEQATFVQQVRSFLEGAREMIDQAEANYYLREYRDKLADRLQAKVEELTRLNAELELRVEERTRELREAQDQLVAMQQEKAVVELANAVAHELRQPQTVILGLAELIVNDRYDRTQLKHALQSIIAQIREMSRLIDTMGQLTSYKTKTFGRDIRIVDLEASAERKDPASVPNPENAPAIDLAVLNYLRGTMGEATADLLDLYLSNASGLVADMRQAAAQGDSKLLFQAAHTLKPGSASLGAIPLAALCAEVEFIGRDSALVGALEKVAQVEAEYQRVKAALEATH